MDEDRIPASKKIKREVAEDSIPSLMSINNAVFESWGSTQIQVINKRRHTWTINNFSLRSEKFHSPTFSNGSNGNKLEWRLELCPNGRNEDNRDAIALYFRLLKYNINEIKIKYKIGIVDAKGKDCHISKASAIFVKRCSWGYDNFIKKDFVFDKKNEILSNDKLTIFFEIIAAVREEDLLGTLTTTPQSDLAKDFAYLLQNKDLCDVTLCIGRKKIKAHKIILMARSPVFRAMFQHDMEENRNNLVKLTDIDEEGLCEMLRFMYTGEICKLKEMAPRLLGMAEKYAMKGLKSICEKALFESLSFENAAEIFILSDKFRSKELKDQVTKFIITHAVTVGKTPGFESMVRTHPHLSIEAFTALSHLLFIKR